MQIATNFAKAIKLIMYRLGDRMDYFAHKAEDGRLQTVQDHLEGTAKLAASSVTSAVHGVAPHAGSVD